MSRLIDAMQGDVGTYPLFQNRKEKALSCLQRKECSCMVL
ncbi:hypothetical protein ARMA_1898 [Ardenticatena maritima]|uniref:Uncharacterized protein n=1 Tax=Ardenticatena maritima TaxID=872965 RepID=A0A0M8K7Q5_9CHLR|nr:hypothetical protein ARMA_1898 [Ardenticatena maritima]